MVVKYILKFIYKIVLGRTKIGKSLLNIKSNGKKNMGLLTGLVLIPYRFEYGLGYSTPGKDYGVRRMSLNILI